MDLLVIGGGISGAGVALEAARRGAKVLLIERQDFAWGASSRSSKLVHGGLRYLKTGALHLTRESVRERERLLRDAPGLVQRLPFVMAHRAGQSPSRGSMQVALRVVDLIAGRRTRGWADAQQAQWLVPGLACDSASLYEDATTDDARLTLRVLQEAKAHGAELRNYTELRELLRDDAGQVRGAVLRGPDGREETIDTRCVIAAAGAYLGPLATQTALPAPRMRPLRGSHLLLPLWRLPLARAVAWSHPEDGRPVFAYPWQGTLLVGTTDLDHPDLGVEPRIAPVEQAYLLAALAHAFPRAGVQAQDIQCTWAGIRPVIDSGHNVDPSKESREHLVLADRGLVALSGGKLTTFRPMAQAALAAAAPWLPTLRGVRWDHEQPVFGTPAQVPGVPEALTGRWGPRAAEIDWSEPLAGTTTALGEIRHSLRHEQVRHLDDLLLRRTRLGLLVPGFAARLLPALQPLCQDLLGWSAAQFDAECERYLGLMTLQYGPAP
jgi:glycerol-3-phosphate dehydrogenase